ncbi:MAG: hypothetical protein HQL47_04495 [Gammaproteobacteria bacterium]|nr:hypothetical protein [Gammaproteobacteria bacterium]
MAPRPEPKPEKIIDVQIASWVENLCASHNISDPEIIGASKRKVKHYIISHMEEQNLDLNSLTPLLADALKILNKQLGDIEPQEI